MSDNTLSRRGALKKFGLGLAGIALASLGLANRAQASAVRNRCINQCKKSCAKNGAKSRPRGGMRAQRSQRQRERSIVRRFRD